MALIPETTHPFFVTADPALGVTGVLNESLSVLNQVGILCILIPACGSYDLAVTSNFHVSVFYSGQCVGGRG